MDSLSASQPGHIFTCFSELPNEIRLKIWGLACSYQRNVDIWEDSLGTIRTGRGTHIDSYKFFTLCCSHPAVLHVCKQAREEALRHYKLDYGTSHVSSVVTITTPPRIYVNYSCDRICLPMNHSYVESRLRDLMKLCRENRVHSVAINVANNRHYPYLEVTTLWDGLEEIVLFGSSMENFRHNRGEIDFVEFEGVESEWNDNTPLGHDRSDRNQGPVEVEDVVRDREPADVDFDDSEDPGHHALPFAKGDGDEAAIRSLRSASKDFYELYTMREQILFTEFALKNGRPPRNDEMSSWRLPVIRIRRLVVNGVPDYTHWC